MAKDTEVRIFQVPAGIPLGGIRTLADGTLKITIETPELTEEEYAKLFKIRGGQGYFLFKNCAFTEEDIKDVPEIAKEFKTDKSPSQRLRNVIYLIWEKNTDKKEQFDAFYKKNIENIIKQYKDKLED